MLNEVLLLNKGHEKAALTILDRILQEPKPKYILTISGEVETGKSEVAHILGRLLKQKGFKPKLMYLDSYYKIPPSERKAWRLKNGIENVGYSEYDWDKINENIEAFLHDKKALMPCVDLFTGQIDQLTTDFKGIDFLIIAGLYSMKVETADLKVFIELTYKETIPEQKASGKEELNDYRMQVLEQEHKVVQSLKNLANYFIDYDNNPEAFHY